MLLKAEPYGRMPAFFLPFIGSDKVPKRNQSQLGAHFEMRSISSVYFCIEAILFVTANFLHSVIRCHHVS